MSRDEAGREKAWRGALGLAVALLAPAGLRGAPPPPAPSMKLSPETVEMGAFYSGAKVRIEGEAPPGTDVVIVVRGTEEAEFFNRKARVGPVWVNVDRVHVAGVPALFLRLGGGDLRTLLDPASIEEYQLDDAAIKSRMTCRSRCKPNTPCAEGVEPDEGYAELIRTSYLALKAEEGTFQVHPDAVRLAPSGDGVTRYAAEVDWPRRARAGSYRVEALACRDRSVLGRTSAVLQLVEAGFPARVGALAETHPTAYGLAAVLAAVIGGFAMDTLVRRRRRPGANRRPPPPKAAPRATEPVPKPAQDEQAEPLEAVGSGRR